MDATTRAIAYALEQWHANEPKPCQIIDLAAERARRERAAAAEPPPGGEAA